MEPSIIKIIPNPEELQITNRQSQGSLRCYEAGCSYEAANSSILGLHKAQAHNIRTTHPPRNGSVVHYHCPVAGCYYSSDSERFLKSLDILRTHYMKMHSEKKFMCRKCSKPFGLERDCHRHEKECGDSYICRECQKVFNNKAALVRHCDYQGHRKPENILKVKPVEREKAPLTAKVKKKNVKILNKVQPFILPKQIPVQQNSLEIQTDASGAQFFIISKLTADCSVSQSVQTMHPGHNSSSVRMQNKFNTKAQVPSNCTKKLSTGMQTMNTNSPNLAENLCVATQTGESILQKAMTIARIPVVKVCKATQKSLSYVPGKRGLNSTTSSSNESQTCGSLTVQKRKRKSHCDPEPLYISHSTLCHDKGVQKEFDLCAHYLMSTMSTQTNLSYMSGHSMSQLQHKISDTQLQDSHTQTLNSQSQIIQTDIFSFGHDQVTQTGSNGPNLQTDSGRAHSLGSSSFGFLPIQDSQTQTSLSHLSSCHIHSSHTQTQISGITNMIEVQDQGTVCDGLFSINLDHLIDSDHLQLQSTFSPQTESQNLFSSDQQLSLSLHGDNTSNINQSGIDFLLEEENLSPTMKASNSNESLTNLLMEDMDNDRKSLKNGNSSSIVESSNKISLVSNVENDLDDVPVTSMETQTFGSLGMDSMTQTIDDLQWTTASEAVDDLFTDMMTQTGDDLLEFLTSDNQSLITVCDKTTSADLDNNYSQMPVIASTSDNSTQINLDTLFADNASTQTVWDSNDQVLDFQSASFSVPQDTILRTLDHIHPGSFLEKELNATQDFDLYTKHLASDARKSWANAGTTSETTGTQIYLSDFVRDVETSETQTLYDPLFSNLDNLAVESAEPTKCIESSHTQTISDPMLPAFVSDDDPQESLFTRKATLAVPKRSVDLSETAVVQTQWEVFLTPMGTSQTQTCTQDFFGVSCSDIQTQTSLESGLMGDLDLTDSFTQTSMDQNTQTGSLFDF